MTNDLITNNKTLSLKWQWECVRVSAFIFPFFPEVGGLGFLVVAVSILRREYRQIGQYPINWALALLSIWLIITSCLASHPQDALLGLANFLPFFLLLATFTPLIQTTHQLRQLGRRLVLPSGAVVFLGLGQLFLGWEKPLFLNSIISSQLAAYGEPEGRMSSIFMYANLLGAYLLIMFILGIGLWLDTYYSWRKGTSNHHKYQVWLLGFLTITIIADGIGLILTDSRNAWGLALLACIAFALYLGWRWILTAIGVILGAIMGATWGPSPLREWLRRVVPAFIWARLSDQLYPDRPVETLRITQWKFAWNMTTQKPWIGWGLRNFTPFYQAETGLWLGHPHNLYLMLLAETGIIGILLLCGVVGWSLMNASRLLMIRGATIHPAIRQEQLILFTYVVAFGACILFNTVDVTVLDGKMNMIGWLLLSAISGVVKESSV